MEKTPEFYLQRTDDPVVWEQVDAYTWENYKKALLPYNTPRYSGNRFSKCGSEINIECKHLGIRELTSIARICGMNSRELDIANAKSGFCSKPEYVKFKFRNRSFIHEVFGDNFKQIAAKKQIQVTEDQMKNDEARPDNE